MSRRWPAGLVALVAVFALASTGLSKPPDLPKYQNVTVMPSVSDVVADPALLQAYGFFNSYPIQMLNVEDFDAPRGEEASELPAPEVIRHAPHEEPDGDCPCPEKTGHACPRPSLMESKKRLEAAQQAMEKVHERLQAGDYAGAVKFLEQARELIAGSACAGSMDAMLKQAIEHFAALEAAHRERKMMREAQQYLLEKHGVEPEVAPTPPDEAPNSGDQGSGEAKQVRGTPAACGRVVVFERRGAEAGSCWVGRAVQVAGQPDGEVKVEVRVEVSAGVVRPMKAVRRVGCGPQCPAVVNGAACEPKTCCSMAACLHNVPLLSALEYVRSVTGCEVVIDVAGLHQAGVSPVEPVSLDVQGMPLYSALDLMLRPHGLRAVVSGGTIHVTCSPECRAAATGAAEKAGPNACGEDVCPKCSAMHAQATKAQEDAARRMMVEGLLKACRLAVMDGRFARAAELAREAHALDAARVECEPMVIKLDLLGQHRAAPGAPTMRILTTGAARPAAGSEEAEESPEGETRLVPHLPGVFADVVDALDAAARRADAPKK